MELYLGLEPFAEVPAILATLRDAGFGTAILSNGSPRMLEALVKRSQLEAMFDDVLSADAVGVFKTHPRVDQYTYTLDSLRLPASAISFQSSNAWDAHRASDFGMRVVWCNRYGQRRERLPGAPNYWPNYRPCSIAAPIDRAGSSFRHRPTREPLVHRLAPVVDAERPRHGCRPPRAASGDPDTRGCETVSPCRVSLRCLARVEQSPTS
jgi:hypothetical protein